MSRATLPDAAPVLVVATTRTDATAPTDARPAADRTVVDGGP